MGERLKKPQIWIFLFTLKAQLSRSSGGLQLGCISSQEAGGESLEEGRAWEAGVWPASCLKKMKNRQGGNTTDGVLGDVTSHFLLTIHWKESQCPSGEPHPYTPADCPDPDFFDWILNVFKIRHSSRNFRLSWCLSGVCLPFSPLSLFSPPTKQSICTLDGLVGEGVRLHS